MSVRHAPMAAFALLTLAMAAASATGEPASRPGELAGAGWDPAIHRGILDNGLSYFVHENETPAGRVSLRLILRVGSLVEEDDERGLAHFCEHLSLKGSEHFPPGELRSWLESMDMGFMRHANASTGEDEVEYFLDLPSEQLPRALLLFRDFAGGGTLSDEEIERERQVVLAEARLRNSVGRRLSDSYREALLAGTPMAGRSPIGIPDVIEQASPKAIRAFYRRWYQPHLMGLMIVGDIDARALEAEVRELFGSLPGAEVRDFPRFPVDPSPGVAARIFRDEELATESVMILHARRRDLMSDPQVAADDERSFTAEDKKGYLGGEMAWSLLRRRLEQVARRPETPFVGAGLDAPEWSRGVEGSAIRVAVRAGQVAEALRAVTDEIERIRQHGFLPSEIEDVKTEFLRGREQWLAGSTSRSNGDRLRHLRDAFVWDGMVLTDADEDAIVREALMSFDGPSLVTRLLERVDTPRRVVVASGPPDASLPSEQLLVTLMEAARERRHEPWREPAVVDELVPDPLPAGRVLSRHAVPELGVEELELSNGMRVVVKSVSWQPDELYLAAHRAGGWHSAPARAQGAAMLAPAVEALSGTADHTPEVLDRLLADELAGLRAQVTALVTRLSGGCAPSDFETLAQLVHLAFTRPGFRAEAHARAQELVAQRLEQQSAAAQSVLLNTAQETLSGGLFVGPTPREIRAIQLPEVEALWGRLFADPGAWTIVLAGAIDLDAALPIIERWLASIPRPPRAKTRPDLSTFVEGFRIPGMPRGEHARALRVGRGEAALTAVVTQRRGDAPLDALLVDNVTSLLEARLTGRLREALGASYSVGVGLVELDGHRGFGGLAVLFDAPVHGRSRLVRIVHEELRRVREELVTAEELAALKEGDRSDWRVESEQPGRWAGMLADSWLHGDGPDLIVGIPERIEQKTARDIRRAARRLIDPKRTCELFTVPEAPAVEAERADGP